MSQRIVNGVVVELTPQEIADIEASQIVEPSPPPAPVPMLVASGVFTVTDGWLEGVGAAAGIGMAFAVGAGTYWIMFSDPQPDLAYAAQAGSSHGQINAQRYIDYVEITVCDGGVLMDPAEFSITIMRAL